jgi:Mrp family chromosome partitioning ATPase/capsular polysaccharide biosynthesis protein
VHEPGKIQGGPERGTSDDRFLEQRIEIGRYLEALRRGARFAAVLVLTVVATSLAASLATDSSYRSAARILVDESGSSLSQDQSIERRLATIQRLLTTRSVLSAAAERLGGIDPKPLEDAVRSSVDRDANLVSVVATARSPDGATRIANAVALAFISEQQDAERSRLERARSNLLAELGELGGGPEELAQVQAIRERLSSLVVSEANIGTELQLVERAEPVAEAVSPRPLRNVLIAFFVSVFLAVLIILAREQLSPRVSGARELGRLLGLPVLVGVPWVRTWLGRNRPKEEMEQEAYQTLQALVGFQLPSSRQRTLLVTGAVHDEGKTRVAAGLGRALARAGHRTLLVSADLRWPTLHENFNIPSAPGFADVLALPGRAVDKALDELIVTRAKDGRRALWLTDDLHVLPSGVAPANPARLLSDGPVDTFFQALARKDYAYVIFDAPPLLGIADSQLLARRIDALVVVSRLDRLTVDNALDLRDVLSRLGAEALGVVVVGVRTPTSPYFLRPSRFVTEGEPSAPTGTQA